MGKRIAIILVLSLWCCGCSAGEGRDAPLREVDVPQVTSKRIHDRVNQEFGDDETECTEHLVENRSLESSSGTEYYGWLLCAQWSTIGRRLKLEGLSVDPVIVRVNSKDVVLSRFTDLAPRNRELIEERFPGPVAKAIIESDFDFCLILRENAAEASKRWGVSERPADGNDFGGC